MLSVLFIGNSYTYFNDMPQSIFAPMAEKAGLPCEVTSATKGGAKLIQYMDPDRPHYAILRDAIGEHSFDWVILQEQSHTPVTNEPLFRKGASEVMAFLCGRAKHFLFYGTWGRKEGSKTLIPLCMTSAQMTDALAAAYDRVGAELGVPVAHVGKAFAAYRKEHPEAELYNPDCSHPSELGSRIAAQTILNFILEEERKDER